MARTNATPVQVTVSGNSIPASGPVNVTTNITFPSVPYGGSTVGGTLAGVRGEITSSGTFVRHDIGSSVSVSPGAPFYTDVGVRYRGAYAIIWEGGLNSGGDDYRAAWASMRNYNASSRILYLTSLTTSTDTVGTSGYNAVASWNTWLISTFGSQVLDIRRYLIDSGLTDAGISPTAQDLTDIAGDTVPTSLRSDTIHLTNVAYALVGTRVYAKLQSLGWA